MKSIKNSLLCLVALASPGFSQISLGSAAPYALLAVRGIISSGSTLVTGDMGTTGQSITGFPPGIVTGTSLSGTSVTTPETDAVSARTAAQALTGATTLAASLGTEVLTPGIYKFSRTAALTAGTLTLSGAGQFIFQVASSLTSAAGSEIVLADGADASEVFWATGSSVTLAADTTFVGSILAAGIVTIGSGAIVNGSVFSGSSITLTDNEIGVVAL